jgi:hypothetical protein
LHRRIPFAVLSRFLRFVLFILFPSAFLGLEGSFAVFHHELGSRSTLFCLVGLSSRSTPPWYESGMHFLSWDFSLKRLLQGKRAFCSFVLLFWFPWLVAGTVTAVWYMAAGAGHWSFWSFFFVALLLLLVFFFFHFYCSFLVAVRLLSFP